MLLAPLAVLALSAAAPTSPRPRRFDALGLSSHVAAAVGAGFELYEDVEEIGHGHGMALLCVSKLAREINNLREQAIDTAKELPGRSWKLTAKEYAQGVFRMLTSTPFAVLLSCLALFAAGLEVIDDLSPGGHHGAVLLALNELMELLETSGGAKGVVLRVLENTVLRLVIVAGATVAALAEVFGSGQLKLGGHHGVAVLAACKTLRCVGLVRSAWSAKRKEA